MNELLHRGTLVFVWQWTWLMTVIMRVHITHTYSRTHTRLPDRANGKAKWGHIRLKITRNTALDAARKKMMNGYICSYMGIVNWKSDDIRMQFAYISVSFLTLTWESKHGIKCVILIAFLYMSCIKFKTYLCVLFFYYSTLPLPRRKNL